MGHTLALSFLICEARLCPPRGACAEPEPAVLCVGALGAVPCCCASHRDLQVAEGRLVREGGVVSLFSAGRTGSEDAEAWVSSGEAVGAAGCLLCQFLQAELLLLQAGSWWTEAPVLCPVLTMAQAWVGSGLSYSAAGKGFSCCLCPSQAVGALPSEKTMQASCPCGSVGRVKALGRQRLGLNLLLCSDVQLLLMSAEHEVTAFLYHCCVCADFMC